MLKLMGKKYLQNLCLFSLTYEVYMYWVYIGLTSSDMSSADNLCKQFGPRSGPTECRFWSGSKLFDTQSDLERNLKKLILKKSAVDKNAWKMTLPAKS